jgi:hypothetical protein
MELHQHSSFREFFKSRGPSFKMVRIFCCTCMQAKENTINGQVSVNDLAGAGLLLRSFSSSFADLTYHHQRNEADAV